MTARVELLDRFGPGELNDLCDATEAAILAGGGFGWVKVPDRDNLEAYWRSVLLVPERRLIVARLDGTVCGSVQLWHPPRNNEAQAFAAQLQHVFVAPWARGQGLGRQLVEAGETVARDAGFEVLFFDIRETQSLAIEECERLGFVCWGLNPVYAKIEGRFVGGRYYYKRLAA